MRPASARPRSSPWSEKAPETLKEAIHPIDRPGYPEDVAPVVVFLAQDDTGFATGAPFFMEGGLIAQ